MGSVKSYAVIGMGGLGRSIARTLAQEGMEVMIIDIHKDKINELASEVTYALQLDVTNETAMKNIGLESMDGVVIAVGQKLEVSAMATILCKEMGVPLVIAKAETMLQKKILEKIGADQVILPEVESGFRLAKNIVGNFMDYFNLSGNLSIVEIPVRQEWINHSLRELQFRNNYNLNIIAINHKGQKEPERFLEPDQNILEGDILIVAGRNEDIENLQDK